MKITGIITLRDGIKAGYPFAECILSIYPIVDEFFINDGGSADGTKEYLEKLQDTFPKIELFNIPDYKSKFWECIDDVLNHFISISDADWILESQADEMYHERTLMDFKRSIEYADQNPYNSIRQRRIDIHHLYQVDPYQYKIVRAVRNIDNLKSYEGGDSFHIGKHGVPRKGFTSHNVPPELDSDIPFYHLLTIYKYGRMEKIRRHAFHLATLAPARLERWRTHKDRKEGSFLYCKPEDTKYHDLPILAKYLGGEHYKPNEMLFNIDWLNKVTKLVYD